jgi:hypothetical protein
VFFKGLTKTRTNPDLPYSSKELIAHEIAHTINWRYPRHIHKGRVSLPELDVYYEKRLMTPRDAYVLVSGDKVLFARLNDGYTMAARSSNGSHETVTDAIACLTLDRFTIDSTDPKKQLLGKARREQIGKLMSDVIRYRVNDYGGGIEALKEEITKRWNTSVLGKMSPMLGTLAAEPNSLDSQIEMLKEKLAES